MVDLKIQNILVIGFVWPEPNSSAAGGRMMQLIDCFLAQNSKITFACAAADSAFMLDVKEVGIEKVSIELNNSSFDDFIRNLQPTLVLFDRFMVEEQFGWRVAKECPDALRILDTEDLHCLRAARQIALKEKREFTSFDLFSDIAKREIASILRCDLSLIISLYEMELLTKIVKIDPAILLYLPFLLDPILPEISNQWPSFAERKHFVFIGNFLHAPNWDAVKFLKEEVWSLIRKKIPEAELHIYGAYPSQKALQLNAIQEGFHCLGRAENASEVVSKSRVCLAPVRFGAGIKGKLVEAMQCGTPSVTTTIGSESMHGDLAWNGFVSNTPEDIAEAAVQLYTDPLVWEQSQKNGITIIEKIYSKSFYRKKLIDQIFHIQSTLKDHRLQNFIGAMLMHHTLASTKYMSKWIEEKNK